MQENPETRAKEIVNWIVSKNHRRVRAWEQNLDFQRLLARLYTKAEEYAFQRGATFEEVTMDGNLLITPGMKRFTWKFAIKPKKA